MKDRMLRLLTAAGTVAAMAIAGGASRRDALTMSIPPNMQQRDLVRLALLVCGDRPSEKHHPPLKGSSQAK